MESFAVFQVEENDIAVFNGRNLELQKLILDKHDVQVAMVIIDGKYMMRVCAQVYNTMEDFVRLADAILDVAKSAESAKSTDTKAVS